MWKWIVTAGILTFLAFCAISCNTIQGVGLDLQELGEARVVSPK